MRTVRLVAAALGGLGLACGGAVDPAALHAQRPFLFVSLTTRPPGVAPSPLPDSHPSVALASTFAFDSVCEVLSTGLHVASRADAAPGLVLELGQWAAVGPSRFAGQCRADGTPCSADLARVRWEDADGRFDAAGGGPADGLAQPTLCAATVVADALAKDQELVEGTCDNLLGSFTSAGAPPVFGPVRLQFRALCRRP